MIEIYFFTLMIADSTPESQKKGKSRFSLFSRSSNWSQLSPNSETSRRALCAHSIHLWFFTSQKIKFFEEIEILPKPLRCSDFTMKISFDFHSVQF